jgi:hypothetical protein
MDAHPWKEQTMDVDRRLERLSEYVRLVDSVGSRWRGELCFMSFVALLGGERHTDKPVCASPLIRSLAIRVNDAMPWDVRQRLKPFAARIVGTNDGSDPARIEVLRQALAEEIQPRVRRDWGAPGWAGPRRHVRFKASASTSGWDIEESVALLFAEFERPLPPGRGARTGSAIGELLARCMRESNTREQRSWYWDEAIGLLDRLCDVRAEFRKEGVRYHRMVAAEERLDGAWLQRALRRVPVTMVAGQS